MANKRNRQKQRNSSKTIEGYESHLLQEVDKWNNTYHSATGRDREVAIRTARRFRDFHEHLRRYYFDL